MPLRFSPAVLLSVSLVLLTACGDDPAPGGLSVVGGGSSISRGEEESRERHYGKLSVEFGKAIKDENWQAAYAMCSTSLKALLPPQQFADTFRASFKEYHQFGKPVDVGGDINTVDPVELDRDEYEIPQSVPSEPRWEAYSFAEMIIEGTAEDPDRCYSIGLLWTKENGQDRVCYFEFEWCD